MTVNVDGIRPRSRGREHTFGSLLIKRLVYVCLLLATHQYAQEVRKENAPCSEYANHKSREDEAPQFCGRVAIFVCIRLHFGEMGSLPRPPFSLATCATLFLPQANLTEAIRITAVCSRPHLYPCPPHLPRGGKGKCFF